MDDSTSSASDAHSMMSPLRGTSDVVEKAITNLIERASPKHFSPQIENNVERIQVLHRPGKFSFNRWTARANVRTSGPTNVSEFRGFPRAR